MKPSDLKFLVRECLQEVISDATRACMYCDVLVPPTQGNRSHGVCREHSLGMLMQQFKKSPEEAAAYVAEKEKAGTTFPPNTSGAKPTDPLPKAKPLT